MYDGGVLVSRSVSLGEYVPIAAVFDLLVLRHFLERPIIYVSVNYRVSFLGFPSGKEAKAAGAGNLGLYDREYLVERLSSFCLDELIENLHRAGSPPLGPEIYSRIWWRS